MSFTGSLWDDVETVQFSYKLHYQQYLERCEESSYSRFLRQQDVRFLGHVMAWERDQERLEDERADMLARFS